MPTLALPSSVDAPPLSRAVSDSDAVADPDAGPSPANRRGRANRAASSNHASASESVTRDDAPVDAVAAGPMTPVESVPSVALLAPALTLVSMLATDERCATPAVIVNVPPVVPVPRLVPAELLEDDLASATSSTVAMRTRPPSTRAMCAVRMNSSPPAAHEKDGSCGAGMSPTVSASSDPSGTSELVLVSSSSEFSLGRGRERARHRLPRMVRGGFAHELIRARKSPEGILRAVGVLRLPSARAQGSD